MQIDIGSLILALLAGIAVSAACGLRAFLPLLVIGLGARFFHLELHPGVAWLSGTPALLALGTATMVEILGDKIPVVDHALDVIGTFLRPVSAVIATYGVLLHFPTPWAQIIALVMGGSALLLHVVKAKTRVGSSALTLGLANPALSVVEDLMSIALVVIAFVAPIVVALLLLVVFLIATRRRRGVAPAAPAPR